MWWNFDDAETGQISVEQFLFKEFKWIVTPETYLSWLPPSCEVRCFSFANLGK